MTQTKQQFLALHVVAISVHTICFIYSLAAIGDAPIKSILRTVRYNSVDSYYTLQKEIELNLPSVMLLHGVVALVTALFHAFLYLPMHYRFAQNIWTQGFFALRWVEYSITCTLMTLSSVMSSGTEDFNSAVTVIISGVALQLIGCTIEQLKEQWKVLVVIGLCVEFAVVWSLVWYTLTSTTLDRYQWIEVLSFLFYYSLFPLTSVIDAAYRKACFVKTDWTYNVLSITSKFALFWLQVGKLKRPPDRNTELQVYGLGVTLPFIVLLCGVYLTPSCGKIDGKADKQPPAKTDKWIWQILYAFATVSIVKRRNGVTPREKKRASGARR